ncbi:MAG TPA: enoyl-CoA hydratase-related protein [Terriglobia bacterium]|nr:enoyl-CoA hydratase-related protein [Terriglobia bacterium]
MHYTSLRFEVDGNLATLTLNRPEKRNAISAEMIVELLAALEECANGSARVVILTGAGKAFCAGMDLNYLKEFPSQSPEQITADARRITGLFRRIWSFPKPLIAAVNGAAIAGGTGIATLCDFTLAAPEATFGYTEVRIGFMPAIVSAFLVRQVGGKRARDLLLSGRILTAQEALSLGLVSEIVPSGKLLDRARELATTLALMSPTALAFTKRLLVRFADADLDRELEIAIEESARIRTTSDFREGLAAYLEKRKPVWGKSKVGS